MTYEEFLQLTEKNLKRFFPTIHFCTLQMKTEAGLHRYGNFIWDRDAWTCIRARYLPMW